MTKNKLLLDRFVPNNYKLHLDIAKNKQSFKGSVVINGQLLSESKELHLHAKGLKISSAKINGQAANSKKSGIDIIVLSSPKTIEKGKLEAEVHFSAKVSQQMHGLYPSSFKVGKKSKTLLATQFESHHAREVFPCIDEPEAKAIFDISVVSDPSEAIVSNTPIKEQLSKDGQLHTKFASTPIMSTYLLAVINGELEFNQKQSKNGTLTRIYATKDNIEHTDFALDVAVKVLDYFENYFGIAFPLDKLDHIALPDFAAGAMENWGCITYREALLIIDPKNTSLINKQRVAIVIAHEIAHQWFGNLVTMQWWTDLWLNEGFASWAEYLAVDELFPDWHMWTQFISDDMVRGMTLDSLASSHPVEVPIATPDDIRGIFDEISYSKGASVIRMLHGFLGAEDFQKGLQHYLEKRSYKNARTKDLWADLEEVSKKPVKDFMETWTSETGFPLVHVSEKNNALQIKQERYLINPKAQAANTQKTIWPLPLQQANQSKLQTDESDQWNVSSDSYPLINDSQSGFFMSSYASGLQAKLSKKIQSGSLSEPSRMGLVNDSWQLSKAGYQPTTEAIELIGGMPNESSAAVWDIIAIQIGSLRRVMSDDEFVKLLRPFVGELAKVQVNRLGWSSKSNEPHFDKLLRPLVLSLSSFGDNLQTKKQADKLYAEMSSPEDIEPDLRGLVFFNAARYGDQKTFDNLLKHYRSTQSAQIKSPLIAGLVSFSQPEIHKQVFDLMVSDEVKPQEIHNWLGGSFSNRFASESTWSWLKDNWQWFVDSFGSDIMTFSHLPKYAASNMHTKSQLQDFTDYFAVAQTDGIERQIEQGKEIIEWQSAWRQRDQAAVKKYLSALAG